MGAPALAVSMRRCRRCFCGRCNGSTTIRARSPTVPHRGDLRVRRRAIHDPAKNMNFVFADPFVHCLGARARHVAVSVLFMLVVVYLPTHLLLKRLYPPPIAAFRY